MIILTKKATAIFWQHDELPLPQNKKSMNRIPLDEMYLLYSLYGFRELKKEEQSRFSIIKFEYEPHPEMFMARLLVDYENVNGAKARLSFDLAGRRSDDHFYEHVMIENNGVEIEFSDFRKAIDYCNKA